PQVGLLRVEFTGRLEAGFFEGGATGEVGQIDGILPLRPPLGSPPETGRGELAVLDEVAPEDRALVGLAGLVGDPPPLEALESGGRRFAACFPVLIQSMLVHHCPLRPQIGSRAPNVRVESAGEPAPTAGWSDPASDLP